MVAFLEKTDRNAEFHEIIDFLTRSSIYYALTVCYVVSMMFVEQFWMTSKSKTINNVRYITAIVVGKPVSISEASIRSDLHLMMLLKALVGKHGGYNSSCTIKIERLRIMSYKKRLTLHKDPAFDDLDDAMDYMETEDAHDEGTARVEADSILAARLQEEEREKFTIEERAKLLMIYCCSYGRFIAQQELLISRKYTLQELILYEKVKSSDENFVAIGSAKDERIIRELNKKADGIKKANNIKEESKEEAYGTRRREAWHNENYDIQMRTRRWNFEVLDKKVSYHRNETKYQNEVPKGFDRVLWGDLMIMFNPNDEDEFWNTQQDWNVVSWKLHRSSGVHTLMTDTGLDIHMLVEKKYPLKRKVLLQMLELKLESKEDSTMEYMLAK
ncbi:hypothetical protein Tco_1457323 [Tanacetum coccineum]